MTKDDQASMAVEAHLSRSALAQAIDASTMPMILSDPHQHDNPIVYANDAFVQLSGYDRAELIGRNCRFLQGDETDPKAVDQIRHAIAAREPVSVELLNYRKDGSTFVNELFVRPIFDDDGELTHYFACQTDVTAFTLARQALGRSEDRYRTLFDSIDEGFCVIEFIDGPHGPSSDYVHVEVNQAFADNAGLQGAQGRSARDLIGDEAIPFIELYRTVLETGRPMRVERELSATGRHLDLSTFRVGPEGGRQLAVLFKDVTDRRHAELALRELTSNLETEVENRTRDLVASQDALRQSQKMEAIGQLTGGVAHDFNNLLTVIRSAAELLTRDGLSPERRDRYAAAIIETADRAANLTNQLLAFARRQPLMAEQFDPRDRARGMLDLLRQLVGPGIEIGLDASDENICVETDAAQFETAIINLAVNARDAMPDGGELKVGVRTVDEVPAVRGHPPRRGTFAEVSVRDSGTGIPDDVREHIFEPFFTTKELGKGTGLGLSQVYGFVKQAGGEVDVTSSSAGTTFLLYLPLSQVPETASEVGAATVDAMMPPTAARILVVEDDAALAPLALELLQELGHRPVLARASAPALELLSAKDGAFDLIFSDVLMPGMSGLELAKIVRDRYPTLPVLLTSGYSDALALDGAQGFDLLRKPYSAKTLSKAITTALTFNEVDRRWT